MREYRLLSLASPVRGGGGSSVTRVEGIDIVKGVGVHPHPQQAGPKTPSSLNVREKMGLQSVVLATTDSFNFYLGERSKE
jgi:hypothetical protein